MTGSAADGRVRRTQARLKVCLIDALAIKALVALVSGIRDRDIEGSK
jgi:hypothetical protein